MQAEDKALLVILVLIVGCLFAPLAWDKWNGRSLGASPVVDGSGAPIPAPNPAVLVKELETKVADLERRVQAIESRRK